MRFIISILGTALTAWLLSCFIGWPMIAAAAFCWAPIASKKPGRCFLNGFLGIFLLWLCIGLWRDAANDHLLSARLAKIFFVQSGYLYLLAAALIGGLIGGLGGWTAALVYKAASRKTGSASGA